MQRRKAVSLRTLALIVVPGLFALTYQLAAAQRPGGPPGGPGGSWVLDYNANGGKVTINGSDTYWDERIVKDAQGWYTSQGHVGDYGHPGTMPPSLLSTTVTSAGSPKIRLRWVGGGTVPKDAWIEVDSSATWTSTRGPGSINNGFPNDPVTAIPNGETKRRKHIIRLTGGSERIWSVAVSATATATSLATDAQGQTAAADIKIIGAVANKSASLARGDGGDMWSYVNDVYTTHTLLSWDDSDGISPGPTTQTLTGTYGGIWSKLPDGTTDNVILNWKGAFCGAYTLGPVAGQDHHTTPYPGITQSMAVMPYADLATCSQKTQDWKYTVSDQGPDKADLDLTCHWICHFAYENYRLPTDSSGQPIYSNEFRIQTLDTSPRVALSASRTSASTTLSGGSFVFMASFTDYAPNASLPGFTPQLKHIGLPALTARIGQSTTRTILTSVTANWNGTNEGNYVVEAQVVVRRHGGLMDVWNAKGETAIREVGYQLDNETSQVTYGNAYVRSGGA